MLTLIISCLAAVAADPKRRQRPVHGEQTLPVGDPHPTGDLCEGPRRRQLEPRTGRTLHNNDDSPHPLAVTVVSVKPVFNDVR